MKDLNITQAKKVIKEVIKEIKPPKDIYLESELMLNFLKPFFKDKAEVMIGGSIAKKTAIKGQSDCDVFVRFKIKDNYSNYLKNILESKEFKNKFKEKFNSKPIVIEIRASRNYYILQSQSLKLLYELVPVKYIKNVNEAENITDASAFHVKYINSKLNDKLRDECRIARLFFKANKLYGAESYIRGFSGHVIDLLIIYYKGFINLLKESINWKKKVYIDIEKQYRSKQDAFFNLNKSKLQSPLILIDPIQKTRNAAASLSDEKYLLFKKTAKKFLENPSRDFFEIKIKTVEQIIQQLNKRFKYFVLIELKSKEKYYNKDIFGSKILKFKRCIDNALKNNNFNFKSGFEYDNLWVVWFASNIRQIDNFKIIQGPFINQKPFVDKFKKKHKDVFVKNERYFAKIKIKDPFFINNVIKSINQCNEKINAEFKIIKEER